MGHSKKCSRYYHYAIVASPSHFRRKALHNKVRLPFVTFGFAGHKALDTFARHTLAAKMNRHFAVALAVMVEESVLRHVSVPQSQPVVQ